MNKTEKEPAQPEITVAESCKKKHWSGLFDLIDENGDGALSWHEFLNDSRIKNCSDLMAKVNTFTNADTDRDGKVTKKEFITYMSEWTFKALKSKAYLRLKTSGNKFPAGVFRTQITKSA